MGEGWIGRSELHPTVPFTKTGPGAKSLWDKVSHSSVPHLLLSWQIFTSEPFARIRALGGGNQELSQLAMDKIILLLWWITWDPHSRRTGRLLGVLRCQGSARGRLRGGGRVACYPKEIRCGTLDRQKDREVNVLVFYKSFGGNYVLFMFIFECIWIFITDIFQRCRHWRQSWGNGYLKRMWQGLTWLAEGERIIHILKSSLKLAFKGTKSEWNSKVLNRDDEVLGFKRKI